MSFSTLMNGLFKVKDLFPDMTWESNYSNYHTSTVVITIPVTDENAQLLIDAQKMFAPADDYSY